MFKKDVIEGFDFVKANSYQEFVDTLPNSKENLGLSSNGKPIYGIRVGNTNKPVIYIQGAIHGNHEWSTAHWIKQLAEIFIARGSGSNVSHMIKILRANFDFYFIPLLNPYGYEMVSRGNANGVDLNRNFDFHWEESPDESFGMSKGASPFSEPETQIVRDKIAEIKPIMFIDTHTWGDTHTEGKMILPPTGFSRYDETLLDCVNSTVISTNIDITIGYKDLRPTSGNWGASQVSSMGIESLGITLEAGGALSVKDQSIVGMNYIYFVMQYLLNWLRTGNLLHY